MTSPVLVNLLKGILFDVKYRVCQNYGQSPTHFKHEARSQIHAWAQGFSTGMTSLHTLYRNVLG